MQRALAAIAVALLLLSAPATAAAQTAERPVRLVLQIAVDQLRGDLIDSYSAGYGEGGVAEELVDKWFQPYWQTATTTVPVISMWYLSPMFSSMILMD